MKISIFSHYVERTTGTDDAIYTYLKAQEEEVVKVKFPFLVSFNGAIKITKFSKGVETKTESFIKFYKPAIFSYLKDCLLAFYYGFTVSKNFDMLICTDNILAIVGISLKKLGIVKKTVYQIIDFTPVRFSSKLLNNFYNFLDKIALYNADSVWPLNETMLKARIEANDLDISKINWKVVPYGNDSFKYADEDYQKFSKENIAYFGTISKNKGADLLIPIVLELINRGHKNIKIISVGGGQTEWLKDEVKKAHLEENFEIHGPIESMNEIAKLMFKCGVALAPYYPADKNNFSYYADAGKVKDYLGWGLPIVITDVPPIAKEVASKQAGVIAEYNVIDFADKLESIFSDTSALERFRSNAKTLGKQYSWKEIYSKVFTI